MQTIQPKQGTITTRTLQYITHAWTSQDITCIYKQITIIDSDYIPQTKQLSSIIITSLKSLHNGKKACFMLKTNYIFTPVVKVPSYSGKYRQLLETGMYMHNTDYVSTTQNACVFIQRTWSCYFIRAAIGNAYIISYPCVHERSVNVNDQNLALLILTLTH